MTQGTLRLAATWRFFHRLSRVTAVIRQGAFGANHRGARWSLLVLAATAAAQLEPELAWAQAAVEAEESELEVTAPRVLSAGVQYPEGAEGDAGVTLRFVVGVDGRAKDVEVIVGDEPFASAAVAAADVWLFEPATRGGRPVPVRILMEAHFQQPQPPSAQEALAPADAESPAAEGSTTGETVAPQGGDVTEESSLRRLEAPQEIVVENTRPPASSSISRAEARQIPGALFGDPVRALDILPGVNTMVSGLPLFFVRGAPPGNVGFYVDEIRVPILYHVFLGPSVISPELVESVNLHGAAYPGRYGSLAGGVIEAELRNPTYEPGAGVGLGLWEANGFAESPFAGEKGNVFVAGRYSLSGAVISALVPQTLDYWNYQGLVDYNLTPRDQLRFFAFGAHDFADSPADGFLGTDFHRVDARYSHTFGLDTRAYAGLTLGLDETSFDGVSVSNHSLAGRVRFEHAFSPRAMVRTGLSLRQDNYDLDLAIDASKYADINELLPGRSERVGGGFLEFPLQVTDAVLVIPGVRTDVYDSGGQQEVAVDPRISARVRLHPNVDAIHAVSYSHQPPNFIPSVLPGVSVAGLEGGLQSALQSSAGVALRLPQEFNGRVTAFQNAFFGLTDPYSLSQSFDLNTVRGRQRSLGHAYGLEFELRRPLTRRFGAFASYTLSRSTRYFDSISTLAGSDRTHVLNLAGMYTLGANWRLGARTVAYSGVPGKLKGEQTFPFERTAPFFRVDFRLERRFRLGPKSYWSAVVEVLNATGSREQIHNTCAQTQQGLSCSRDTLPAIVLPNIKIEARL